MADKTSILIVDDDAGLRKTLALVLKRTGYDVTTASDGQEAISLVKQMPFDMCFMDIRMPLVNGVDAYKQMKKIRPKLIVVMMTAYAVEDLIQEALEEGAHSVLYKPLDLEKALALIENARQSGDDTLIMVVDDDKSNCTTLQKILAKQGYNVGIAVSGKQAVSMAKKDDYDLIFIDMHMPNMDGLQTYLRIRPLAPSATAIMMTAYRKEMDDIVMEALKQSAMTCLEKPINIEEMFKIIESAKDKKEKQ